MPGQVGDLNLKPGSCNVSLKWKIPRSNRFCVKHYVIYWLHTLNGNNDNSNVSSEDASLVIEYLEACVEYEVSVRAVNEKNQSTDAVTDKTRTETVGNYHTQIIL